MPPVNVENSAIEKLKGLVPAIAPVCDELLRRRGRTLANIQSEELSEWSRRFLAAGKRIAERAEKENRSQNEDEQAAVDAAIQLTQFWSDELDRRKTFGSGGSIYAGMDGVFNRGRGGFGAHGSGVRFTDLATGREVRALRQNESIAEGFTGSDPLLPDGILPTELSLGRLVRAAVTGDWRHAEAERRAMSVGADVGGGYLVPDALSATVIDLIRNRAVVMAGGAQTIPMSTSELKLAKVTKDIVPMWKGENLPITSSDMGFGAIRLSAKTLAALTNFSIELAEDAQNLDSVILNAISEVLALELDRACLRGDGKNVAPVGIRYAKNVQVVDVGAPGADGASLSSYDFFSQAVEKVATVNGTARTVIFAPRTAGVLDRLKDKNDQPLNPPQSYQGLQKLVSNQIPIDLKHGAATTGTECFVGDFEQLLVGLRTQLTIEISREAGDSTGGAFRNMQVWLRAYMRADCVLQRPEHFVVLDGVL